MTLMNRVIACLDVKDGRVVKGVGFVNLRDEGDPVVLAERYETQGADEIVYLDISATNEGRSTLLDLVQRTAERLFIPLTVAGVRCPVLFTDAAERFGSQCVVASIDAQRNGDSWEVYVNGGREPTGLDAIEWSVRCAELGAGEILLTSIDHDGARLGYDLELLARVARLATIPVIASGGAGSASDIRDAFTRGGADAALLAGLLHSGVTDVQSIKTALRADGIPVRMAA